MSSSLQDRGWHFEGQAYPTIQELVKRQFDSRMPVTTKSGAILKRPILREWELLNDDIELKMKIGTVGKSFYIENIRKSKMDELIVFFFLYNKCISSSLCLPPLSSFLSLSLSLFSVYFLLFKKKFHFLSKKTPLSS